MERRLNYLFFVIVLLCAILFIYVTFSESLEEKDNKKINYCEIYSNQLVTASRVGINGSEREYGLNGNWIKESILLQDCMVREE